MSDMSRSGMDRMKENLKALKQTVIGSFLQKRQADVRPVARGGHVQ